MKILLRPGDLKGLAFIEELHEDGVHWAVKIDRRGDSLRVSLLSMFHWKVYYVLERGEVLDCRGLALRSADPIPETYNESQKRKRAAGLIPEHSPPRGAWNTVAAPVAANRPPGLPPVKRCRCSERF